MHNNQAVLRPLGVAAVKCFLARSSEKAQKCGALTFVHATAVMSLYLIQIGFNKGDGWLAYLNPFSLSSAARYMNSFTNDAVPGRWLYRVDAIDDSLCVLPPMTGKWSNATTVCCCTIALTTKLQKAELGPAPMIGLRRV